MDSFEIFDIGRDRVASIATTEPSGLLKKEIGKIRFEGGHVLTFPLKTATLKKPERGEE